MKAPVAALKAAKESRPGGRINLQESQSTTAATRQIRLLHASKNLQQVRGLGVLHGRRISDAHLPIVSAPGGPALVSQHGAGRCDRLRPRFVDARELGALLVDEE